MSAPVGSRPSSHDFAVHDSRTTHGGNADGPTLPGAQLDQLIGHATAVYLSNSKQSTPWIDKTMSNYSDPQTVARTSYADKQKFAGSFQAGRDAAKNATLKDKLADLKYGNKNPPGQHDSRSMALINSDPARKKEFAAASHADQQRYLFEADFYLRGYDSSVHQQFHQPMDKTSTPAAG